MSIQIRCRLKTDSVFFVYCGVVVAPQSEPVSRKNVMMEVESIR